MNLPNSLTVARIFLVPVLVSVLLTKFEGRVVLGLPVELVAAAIFGIASLTDWLYGYLARRRWQVTWVGQVLDPIIPGGAVGDTRGHLRDFVRPAGPLPKGDSSGKSPR